MCGNLLRIAHLFAAHDVKEGTMPRYAFAGVVLDVVLGEQRPVCGDDQFSKP